ncbi:MAG: hypothetical protein JF606_15385 [Burkholderiales bacterium]|jgi:hypothetical protein|nr:hypothetical protein [Burkholderiales bacterium]
MDSYIVRIYRRSVGDIAAMSRDNFAPKVVAKLARTMHLAQAAPGGGRPQWASRGVGADREGR